jgi:hypothetical protein
MLDSRITQQKDAHALSFRRKTISIFMAILLGFVFFFLPYKVHVAVWSSLTTGNVLFEKSQFHLGVAAMAAMLFGSAGLCADPLF